MRPNCQAGRAAARHRWAIKAETICSSVFCRIACFIFNSWLGAWVDKPASMSFSEAYRWLPTPPMAANRQKGSNERYRSAKSSRVLMSTVAELGISKRRPVLPNQKFTKVNPKAHSAPRCTPRCLSERDLWILSIRDKSFNRFSKSLSHCWKIR